MSTVVETTRARPSRDEIEPAALDLIRRRGAEILATARRYAATEHDAEDAYQRGLEILLTKAPSTREDDLVPWLKTVVKHEAFALRKQRERHGVPSERDELTPAHADTHEHVERLDRLQRGAEALQRLKPAEMRCLVLLAQGHSYAEICAITGFTYTKVNRCLAEGRQSFMSRIDGIESGAECERLAPLVSAAADGEASAEDMLLLKRHLRGCLACRAALRDARSVPARVAALAPAGVLGVPDPGPVHAVWTWLNERLSSVVMRGQQFAEAAAAQKTVAVAASAAALAGGGAATVKTVSDHHPAKRPAAVQRSAPTIAAPTHIPTRPAPKARTAPRTTRPAPEPAPARVSPRPAASHEATPPALPSPKPAAPAKSAAPGDGSGEFSP